MNNFLLDLSIVRKQKGSEHKNEKISIRNRAISGYVEMVYLFSNLSKYSIPVKQIIKTAIYIYA